MLIPCFNHGQYVDEAVDSVLSQNRRDVEIIIVNDGSTDPTTNDLLHTYPRPATRVIEIEHTGLAAARNRGLREARGRYVCALDADDRLAPGCLDRTTSVLDQHDDLAFVSFWLETFGDEQWVWRQERCDFPTLLGECTVCTAALVRREAVLAVGGYDEQMPEQGYEDWDLWVSLVARGHVGTIVPEVLFYYRRTAGSMSTVSNVGDAHLTLMRYLVDKHRDSYSRLKELLLLKEAAGADLLRRNHQLEREIGSRLEVELDVAEQTLAHLRGRATTRPERPPAQDGSLRWGDLRRAEPFSPFWGADRGRCVDRFYIERFLDGHRDDIAGRVLEVHDDDYTKLYGGSRVPHSDVIDIDPENPRSTITADLRRAVEIPAETYDCVILTQTLHVIDDMRAVLAETARVLKPGGVLLATLPCLGRVAPEQGLDGDYWRFTPAATERLFAEFFDPAGLEVEAHGNVLVDVAYLYGLAVEDLDPAEFEATDHALPLVVTVRCKG